MVIVAEIKSQQMEVASGVHDKGRMMPSIQGDLEIRPLMTQELSYPTIHPLGIFLIRTATGDMAPDGFHHGQFPVLKVFYLDLAVFWAT